MVVSILLIERRRSRKELVMLRGHYLRLYQSGRFTYRQALTEQIRAEVEHKTRWQLHIIRAIFFVASGIAAGMMIWN